MQTKTLAGLELGNSGMSVSLGNNGLTFNGLYDNNVLNQFSSLVFDQGTEIDVYAIDQVADVTEDSAANARVFFLATSDSSSSAVAKYMGYVPANLSGKYVKYINLANGEFVKTEEISGNYVETNLPSTTKVDTISLIDSFGLKEEDKANGYASYGLFDSANGAQYFGFGNKSLDNIKGGYMQFRGKKDNEVSGVATTKTLGQLIYIAVDWNDEKATDYSEATLFTKYGSAFGSSAETAVNYANTEKTNVKLTKVDNIMPVTGNYFYGRLGADTGKYAYINSVSFYFDTTKTIPEGEASAVTLDKASLEFFVEDFANPVTQTITATVQGVTGDQPVTFNYDSEIISIDGNGIVTPLKAGTTTLSATSVNFPDVTSAEINVIVKQEETYKATLVTELSEVIDGGVYVIANKQFNKAMSVVQNTNNRGEIDLATLSDNLDDYSLEFKTSDNIQLVTFEAVSTADGAAFENSFALKVDNEKYLYSSGTSNNLRTGNLIYNDTLSLNAVFELLIDNNGNATLKNNENVAKTIRYNESDKMFSCYQIGQNDIQLYSLDKETLNRDFTQFAIKTTNNMVNLGSTVTCSIDTTSFVPFYASIPDLNTVIWTSSDESIATIDGGIVTGKAEGEVTISAKFPSNGYVANINIVVINTAIIQTTSYEAKYTGTTTVNLTADEKNNATLLNLDSSLFEVASVKDEASTHVGLNQNGSIRIYQDNKDGNEGAGGELRIKLLQNTKIIVSVMLEYTDTVPAFRVNGILGSEDISTYEIISNELILKNVADSGQLRLMKITLNVGEI